MMRAATVIIRACARPPAYLERCLASLCAQTRPPAQVVLIDTGVGAAAIASAAKLLDPAGIRLTVTRLPDSAQPAGLGAALNLGLQSSDQEWIAFLDDDDTWEADFLSACSTVLESESGGSQPAAAVTGWRLVYEVERAGIPLRIATGPEREPGELGAAAFDQHNRFAIHAALWRAGALRELGGFDPALPVLEDWELNRRAARSFGFAACPGIRANYHRRPPGSSTANTAFHLHLKVARQLRRRWGCGPRSALLADLRSRAHHTLDWLAWKLRLLRLARP